MKYIDFYRYYEERSNLTYRHKVSKKAVSVKDGVFDMELCLKKFKNHYAEIYTDTKTLNSSNVTANL